MRTLARVCLVLASLGGLGGHAVFAEGETPGGDNLHPVLTVRDAVVGRSVVMTISNISDSAGTAYLTVKRRYGGRDIQQYFGPGAVLVPDVAFNSGADIPFGSERERHEMRGDGETRFLARKVSERLSGATLYLQAFVEDPNAVGGFALSNGVELEVMDQGEPRLGLAGRLPSGWIRAATAYDSTLGVTYMFGGRNSESALATDDIVVFDPGKPFGSQIEQIEESLPSPRNDAVAVWDPVRHVAYVFGGREVIGPSVREIVRFDPSASVGSRVAVLSDRLPFAVAAGSAVWDSQRSVAYLLGGEGTDGEIIEFDPSRSTGSKVTVLTDRLPDSRIASTAVWDSGSSRGFVFGGMSGGGSSDEIIEFDPSRPAGQRVRVSADRLPSPRVGSAATFDPQDRVAYVVGADLVTIAKEVVLFDASRSEGSRVSVAPFELQTSARRSASVFDSVRDVLFVLGGSNDDGDRLDFVWMLSAGDSELSRVGRMTSARYSVATCIDSATGTVYGFGGYGPLAALDEIVAAGTHEGFRAAVDTLPDVMPTGRKQAAAVWDPIRRRAYVFGGSTSFLPDVAEIIEFNPDASAGSRVRVLTERLPFPVAGGVAFWDSRAGVAYLMGGNTDRIFRYNPARPDGSRLDMLANDTLGVSLLSAACVWDPTRGVAYLFGGLAGGSLDEIREFAPNAPDGQKVQVLQDRLPSPRFRSAAFWDTADRAAYILGGDGADHELIRFAPGLPEGQRVQWIGDVTLPHVAAAAEFDPQSRLPLFVGGFKGGDAADTVSVLYWK